MNRFEFNTGDHKEEEEKVLVGRSYGKEVLYRFRKNKGAWISFFIIILLIVIALAARLSVRTLTKKCILNIAICRQGFRDWKSLEFLMV